MLLLFVSYQCFAIEVHQNFSRIFMRTGVVYLGLDFRRRLFFLAPFLLCLFFIGFLFFFSEGFGLVPPSCNFPPFF